MRKLLNKPWFVALLAISAIALCTWSIRDQMGGSRRRAPRPVTTVDPAPSIDPAADPASGPAAESAPVPIADVLVALTFPEKVPDPFSRGTTTIVAGEEEPEAGPPLPDQHETVRLTGVWTQGVAKLAVLNNRIVQSGDRLGRLTVDEVQVDGVWVSHWRGRNFVPFGGEFTLVTPADSTPTLARHEN